MAERIDLTEGTLREMVKEARAGADRWKALAGEQMDGLVARLEAEIGKCHNAISRMGENYGRIVHCQGQIAGLEEAARITREALARYREQAEREEGG